jgi:ribosomal protein L37AE/L43A
MRYNFIPAHIAYPGAFSVIQGALVSMIEQQARDVIAALDEEASRFEAAGNAEMAAALRDLKAQIEAIWNDEPADRPACPACETGRLTPREQLGVWDCDICGATVCPGELVTCPNCGQTIEWDGDEGHCGCKALADGES